MRHSGKLWGVEEGKKTHIDMLPDMLQLEGVALPGKLCERVDWQSGWKFMKVRGAA
jgi:hypothetical protein